jgi:hypothetical protein
VGYLFRPLIPPSGCALPREFLPPKRAHALAAFKTVQVKFFVRRMRVVILQTKSQQQRIRAEDFWSAVCPKPQRLAAKVRVE